MDLKQLDYFVHVADASSFSKAAQLLSVAQPALSRQIRTLEVELRQTLFLRNGRGVTLTPPGVRLLAHARGILQQVERVRAELDESRNAPVGRVAVGVPPSVSRVLSGPLVAEFRARFPRGHEHRRGLTVHILSGSRSGASMSASSTARSPAVGCVRSSSSSSTDRPSGAPGDRGSVELRRSRPTRSSSELTAHDPRARGSRLSALGLKAAVALEIDGIRAIWISCSAVASQCCRATRSSSRRHEARHTPDRAAGAAQRDGSRDSPATRMAQGRSTSCSRSGRRC
jgi:LysR family nitrogen assimilation transcriptional regulator